MLVVSIPFRFFLSLLPQLLLVCYKALLVSLLFDDPVVLKVKFEMLTNEGLPKHGDDLLVVWPLFEFQLS